MPSPDTLREMHYQLVRIRLFEETIQKVYFEGTWPVARGFGVIQPSPMIPLWNM